eukprot:m.197110 g.197110  ORF g.197110 m.197110 type:complete len:55 (+) comp32646_c5_seq1:110-274(+)
MFIYETCYADDHDHDHDFGHAHAHGHYVDHDHYVLHQPLSALALSYAMIGPVSA